MSDRTNGELDAAVIAHRESPTPATRARLMAAMEAHNDAFQRELTDEYQERTHV